MQQDAGLARPEYDLHGTSGRLLGVQHAERNASRLTAVFLGGVPGQREQLQTPAQGRTRAATLTPASFLCHRVNPETEHGLPVLRQSSIRGEDQDLAPLFRQRCFHTHDARIAGSRRRVGTAKQRDLVRSGPGQG